MLGNDTVYYIYYLLFNTGRSLRYHGKVWRLGLLGCLRGFKRQDLMLL